MGRVGFITRRVYYAYSISMEKYLVPIVGVCVLFIVGAMVFMGRGLFFEGVIGSEADEGVEKIVVPGTVLTPNQDSEKLLYDDAFMEEAIKTYSLRSLTQSLSRLGHAAGIDCHNRAHEMGRRAYELLGAEAFKQCGIECHSGCRHGATEAFFADKGTADLIGSMSVLCGEEQDRFNMHQCVHGVGHGLMAWFDYALYDALEACDLIEQQYHRESCYSGVFMENIVGGIVQDERGFSEAGYHHTDFLSDDPHYPCSVVDDKYKYQCYWLQTDQMHRLFGDFESIGVACAEAPEFVRFACFHSMGRTVSGQLLLDPVKSFGVCIDIAYDPGKNACLEGVLNNLMWDESQAGGAIEFCSYSIDSSFEEICYDRLIVQMSEVILSDSTQQFCEKLPEKYHDQCTAQETPRAIPLSPGLSSFNDFVFPKKIDVAVIRYADGAYIPNVVHISVGQEVIWVNESDKSFWPASNIHPTHAAYPGSDIEKCGTSEKFDIFDACEALGVDGKYSFVFDKEGQWRYHDHINPQVTGTVIVSE